MARTYLMYSQGAVVENTFDMDNSRFTGKWTVDTSIVEPSQIYFSRDYYYPNGVMYTITCDGKILLPSQVKVEEADGMYLNVTIVDESLSGKQITIMMSA